MPPLTRQELDHFLATGARLLRLATLAEDGWPYVNPVWYHYEGGFLYVAGRQQARWVGHLRRDPRVCGTIDTDAPPYVRVQVLGTAVVEDEAWLGDWEAWAVRYLGPEEGRRYYQQTREIPRVLVRIEPRRITSWAGPGWHPRYLRG